MKQGESLIDHTVCQMTDAILTRKVWQPGDRLPNERQLAEMYSVSRNTVREAIKVLNANHILVTKPHSGTYVAREPGIDMDPFGFSAATEKYKLMLDLYEMRILVEGAAARMAVQRGNEQEIEKICHWERLCRQYILSDEPWSEADRQFHTAIAEASHNTAFTRIIPTIHQSAHLGYLVIEEDRNRANTLHYHALIAEALVKRDEIGAALACRHHLIRAVTDLKECIRENGGSIDGVDSAGHSLSIVCED